MHLAAKDLPEADVVEISLSNELCGTALAWHTSDMPDGVFCCFHL